MNARARLFEQSIVALLATTVVASAVALLEPPTVDFLVRTAYAALLLLALWLSRRGRSRLAATAVITLGVAAMVGLLLATGGAAGRYAPFLPLVAMAAWSWLGRTAGVVTVGVLCGALAAAQALGAPDLVPLANADAAHLQAYLVGAVVCAAFLAAMIAELRRAATLAWDRAAAAERAAAEAIAADTARDRFLATVSHELRTPLHAILGYAELLREDERDPARAGDLDRIHAAGRQLLGLVGDVIDMSLVERDELRLVSEPVDLVAVLREVAGTAAPLVAAQRNTLGLVLPPKPPALRGDAGRLRQILLNLVSNAAKYTADGTIHVALSAVDGEVRVAVADTGAGLTAEQMGRLFQPFVQLHEGAERRPGVGLGLALSQRLAHRLGGRIEVRSRVGRGSTFTLSLPADGG